MLGGISLTLVRDIAITITAVAGAITMVWAAYKVPVVSKPLRWLGRTLIGDPVGRAAHRALDAWASQEGGINARLGKIEYELRPNSGKSLRDRVDAIGRAVGGDESKTLAD